jgi:hypothetical protein
MRDASVAPSKRSIISTEIVVRNILVIRGHTVMLDGELAALYQVQTRP